MNEPTPRQNQAASPVEPLEARMLFSVGGASVQSLPPPTAVGPYLAGTEWSSGFKRALAAVNGGDVRYGTWWYEPSSWTNVNQVTIRFTQDMTVEARHLRVIGTTGDYAVTSFAYQIDRLNFNGVATWTLARPFAADNVLLVLDAHSPDGVRIPDTNILLDGDRDGHAGGDFRFRFSSLPGSLGIPSPVQAGNLLSVRASYGTSVERPGSGPTSYFLQGDVNADGRIDVRDLAEVRRRMGDKLPAWEPTVASVQSGPNRPTRARPVTRSLFGTSPVLA